MAHNLVEHPMAQFNMAGTLEELLLLDLRPGLGNTRGNIRVKTSKMEFQQPNHS